MKKFKKLFLALVVMFAGIITVNAAPSTPEYSVIGGKKVLLANGTPISIEAPTTEGMGATIKWDGGEIEVPADTSVFGGKHNSTDKENSSITMNGGTVKNVFGGGLHISEVTNAVITINGGKITGAIMGGGYEEFTSCTEGDFNVVTEENAKTSSTRVENVTITVNGGNLDGAQVYGGGGAHSYTGTATITLKTYEGTISYLTAGGSNGHTENAVIEMAGGKVGVLQSVNRGTMNTIEVEINGGEVTNAYVGGENDPGVTGTFVSAELNVNTGKVTNLNPGTNGGVAAEEEITVTYNKDVVENIDETKFAEDTVEAMVIITIKYDEFEESVALPVGTKFTDEEYDDLVKAINEAVADKGIEFEGFYADEDCTKEYNFKEEINESATVYAKFVQLREDDGTKNPETSDISVYGIIAALLLGTVGLGYTIKKRRFN